MMERRYWLTASLLASLVIATQFLVWLTREPVSVQLYAGPPRSDYTLSTFELNALDAAGKLAFTVTGPRLARRGDDGSLDIDSPQYVLVDAGGNTWHGNSEAAWVNKDGSIMKLTGAVDMKRDASGAVKAAEIQTSELTTWPKDKRMATDAPARIVQPGSILRGVGLKADLDAHTFELDADVHAQLQPKARTK